MTVKEVLVKDLGLVLEETGNLMVDKMVLESLAKNGNVSLEEAEFYNTLVRRVLQESAEEFVPDSLAIQESGDEIVGDGLEDMPDLEPEAALADLGADEMADEGEIMVLTGEDGTVYNFNTATCELEPVEGTGGADDDAAALEDPGVGAESESEEVEEIDVAESTEIKEGQMELTESQLIVSNLIKSLGA